ncbi:MAG: SH3 domain-containing protein [Chloroflexota bacterium]
MPTKIKNLLPVLVLAVAIGLTMISPVHASVVAQQPTGSVPTVTGTPPGPIVTVTYPEQINVRAGPHSVYYQPIGVLLPGEKAPALGRTAGGEWIQIAYPGVPGGVGWVYAPLVSLTTGFLPIIEPPPTATPPTTPTIDPTLVAAFQVPLTPTRLPTFTPPAPLEIPTFTAAAGTGSGVPMGLIILGLAFIGLFGAFISFLRGR